MKSIPTAQPALILLGAIFGFPWTIPSQAPQKDAVSTQEWADARHRNADSKVALASAAVSTGADRNLRSRLRAHLQASESAGGQFGAAAACH